MKKIKKIMLVILMTFMVMPSLVFAEEYKVGDLVEVTNPTGGKSQQFYVFLDFENSYHLISKEPIYTSLTLSEMDKARWENENQEFKYLYEIKNDIDSDNTMVSFVQDIATQIYGCKLNSDTSNNTEDKFYLDCPDFYENFINSYTYGIIDVESGDGKILSDEKIVVFEKSDNKKYKFMATLHDEESMKTRKLNHFLWLAVEEENMHLLKKIEEPKVEITTTVPTTTTKKNVTTTTEKVENTTNNKVSNTTQKKEENPKTADINVIYILAAILVFGAIGVIGNKKAKNN